MFRGQRIPLRLVLGKCAESMFYQTNRDQAIVYDLYIESIWLLQCPTANRWRRKIKNQREYGESPIIYLAPQQPNHFAALICYYGSHNAFFIITQ